MVALPEVQDTRLQSEGQITEDLREVASLVDIVAVLLNRNNSSLPMSKEEIRQNLRRARGRLEDKQEEVANLIALYEQELIHIQEDGDYKKMEIDTMVNSVHQELQKRQCHLETQVDSVVEEAKAYVRDRIKSLQAEMDLMVRYTDGFVDLLRRAVQPDFDISEDEVSDFLTGVDQMNSVAYESEPLLDTVTPYKLQLPRLNVHQLINSIAFSSGEPVPAPTQPLSSPYRMQGAASHQWCRDLGQYNTSSNSSFPTPRPCAPDRNANRVQVRFAKSGPTQISPQPKGGNDGGPRFGAPPAQFSPGTPRPHQDPACHGVSPPSRRSAVGHSHSTRTRSFWSAPVATLRDRGLDVDPPIDTTSSYKVDYSRNASPYGSHPLEDPRGDESEARMASQDSGTKTKKKTIRVAAGDLIAEISRNSRSGQFDISLAPMKKQHSPHKQQEAGGAKDRPSAEPARGRSRPAEKEKLKIREDQSDTSSEEEEEDRRRSARRGGKTPRLRVSTRSRTKQRFRERCRCDSMPIPALSMSSEARHHCRSDSRERESGAPLHRHHHHHCHQGCPRGTCHRGNVNQHARTPSPPCTQVTKGHQRRSSGYWHPESSSLSKVRRWRSSMDAGGGGRGRPLRQPGSRREPRRWEDSSTLVETSASPSSTPPAPRDAPHPGPSGPSTQRPREGPGWTGPKGASTSRHQVKDADGGSRIVTGREVPLSGSRRAPAEEMAGVSQGSRSTLRHGMGEARERQSSPSYNDQSETCPSPRRCRLTVNNSADPGEEGKGEEEEEKEEEDGKGEEGEDGKGEEGEGTEGNTNSSALTHSSSDSCPSTQATPGLHTAGAKSIPTLFPPSEKFEFSFVAARPLPPRIPQSSCPPTAKTEAKTPTEPFQVLPCTSTKDKNYSFRREKGSDTDSETPTHEDPQEGTSRGPLDMEGVTPLQHWKRYNQGGRPPRHLPGATDQWVQKKTAKAARDSPSPKVPSHVVSKKRHEATSPRRVPPAAIPAAMATASEAMAAAVLGKPPRKSTHLTSHPSMPLSTIHPCPPEAHTCLKRQRAPVQRSHKRKAPTSSSTAATAAGTDFRITNCKVIQFDQRPVLDVTWTTCEGTGHYQVMTQGPEPKKSGKGPGSGDAEGAQGGKGAWDNCVTLRCTMGTCARLLHVEFGRHYLVTVSARSPSGSLLASSQTLHVFVPQRVHFEYVQFDPKAVHSDVTVDSSMRRIIHRNCPLAKAGDEWGSKPLHKLLGGVGCYTFSPDYSDLERVFWECEVYLRVLTVLEGHSYICSVGLCQESAADEESSLADNPTSLCCLLTQNGANLVIQFWDGWRGKISFSREKIVFMVARPDKERLLRLGFFLSLAERSLVVADLARDSVLHAFPLPPSDLEWLPAASLHSGRRVASSVTWTKPRRLPDCLMPFLTDS